MADFLFKFLPLFLDQLWIGLLYVHILSIINSWARLLWLRGYLEDYSFSTNQRQAEDMGEGSPESPAQLYIYIVSISHFTLQNQHLFDCKYRVILDSILEYTYFLVSYIITLPSLLLYLFSWQSNMQVYLLQNVNLS